MSRVWARSDGFALPPSKILAMHSLDPRDLPERVPHEDEERSRGNRALDDEQLSEFNRPRIGQLEEEE